jgi:hypothetical protein
MHRNKQHHDHLVGDLARSFGGTSDRVPWQSEIGDARMIDALFPDSGA